MNRPQKVESPRLKGIAFGHNPPNFQTFPIENSGLYVYSLAAHHCDRSHVHSAAGEANSQRGAVTLITGSQRHAFLTAHFSYTAI